MWNFDIIFILLIYILMYWFHATAITLLTCECTMIGMNEDNHVLLNKIGQFDFIRANQVLIFRRIVMN